MEKITKDKTKAFNGFNHGKDQIDIKHLGQTIRMRPVEIHLKEDGSITDQPSLAIVMSTTFPNTPAVVGEISVEMLNKGLADIGYELVKKK